MAAAPRLSYVPVYLPWIAQRRPELPEPRVMALLAQLGGHTPDVALSGSVAWLVVGPRLVGVDVSEPARPVVVGETAPLDGPISAVVAEGRHAFAARPYALDVFDVAEPTRPVAVAHVPVDAPIQLLAAGGGHLFGLGNHDPPVGPWTLRVIDVTRPSEPRLAGSLDWNNPATRPRRLAYAKGHLYLASDTDWPGYGVRVLDVRSPAAPVVLEAAAIRLPNHGEDLVAVDDRLFVVGRSPGPDGVDQGGLWGFDLSDPAAPRLLGSVALSGLVYRVAVAAGQAYVGDPETGLVHVVDVRDPTRPTRATGLEPLDGLSALGEGRLLADGGRLLATGRGLEVVDVGDPAQPGPTGRLRIPGLRTKVTADEDTAYLAEFETSGRDVVATVDLRDSGRPRWSASVVLEDDHGYTPYGPDGIVAEGLLLVPRNAPAGLSLFDVRDRAAPRPAGRYDSQVAQGVLALAVERQLAYLGFVDHIQVIDLSRVGAPRLLSRIEVSGGALASSGGHLFAAGVLDGQALTVVDVADPARPVVRGRLPLVNRATHLHYAAGFLYAATASGVQLVDVRSVAGPAPFGTVLGQPAEDLDRSGSVLWASVGGGLRPLEVSEPGRPALGAYVAWPLWPGQTVFTSRHVLGYTAALGLLVLEHP
jgi:hypothetical protein